MPVAVVTGASRGLGRATALALGRAGYSVAILYNMAEEGARETLRHIQTPSMIVKADMGDRRQVEGMASAVYGRWGRIDVLVNNAGITRDGLLLRLPEEDWDAAVRTNLTGSFNAVKSCVPFMSESGGGHVIQISSSSGLRGRAGQSAYSASKAAVIGLTRSLARELGAHNIRANAVLPGYMPTDMGKGALHAMEHAREDSLLHCLSDPREVADFIVFLAGTCTITGQVFALDSRV